MSYLRRIAGVTRHHIRKYDIKTNLKIKKDIVEKVNSKRLSNFDHVARMNEN